MSMKNNKIKGLPVIQAAVLFGILAMTGFSAVQPDSFLKGDVYDFSNAGDLQRSLTQAGRHFRESAKEGLYFIVYKIQSRHQIHMGDRGELGRSYRIEAFGREIKVRKQFGDKNGYSSYSDSDRPGPAGMMFLCRSDDEGIIEDFHLIDLEQEYQFEKEPVYWLGERGNDESFNFIVSEYKHSSSDLKKSLLFAVSIHPGDETYNFLKKTALSEDIRDVRKNAAFWLGTYKDEKSFAMLKDIFQKADDEEVKEHIIFAIQLNESEQAVCELIHIARTETSTELRKKAVFWLGQKASEKSIEALKDVVTSEKEDTEVKESAVFALSRLPEGKSVPILIDIAKTSPYSGIRKQAIFWLGQKSTPEALKFFEEVLLKK